MSDDNAAAARTPADFLKSIKGKPVVVKLNSGVDYRGTATRIRVTISSDSSTAMPLQESLLAWTGI